MATTESGIYYQEDYNADADVLRDMQKMAESIEDKIIKQRLDATQQDITNIKKEQETQNSKISDLEKNDAQQDKSIEALQKENTELKEECSRLREDLKAFPSGSAEGEYITLKDSADSRFNMFRVGGNSKQETREGYNEFDYDTIKPYSMNTEKTNIDGLKAYKCISTNTNIWALFYLNNVLEDGKAYTMCFDIWADKQTTFGNRNFYVNSLTRVEHNLSNITTSKQKLIANFTYKQDANPLIHIYPTTDETNNIYIANVMLLEGTFTLENMPNYEEYGATPSTEFPSEIQNVEGNINETVCNKNLFTGFIKGKGLNPSTGEETQENNKATSDFIETDFNKNSNYYLSGLTDRLWSFIAAYDKNKNFLSRTTGNPRKEINLNKTSITNKNGEIKFIRITQYENIGIEGTIDDIDNLQVQLEPGNTATNYVEHQEQNFTFPLAQGQKLMLGDYLADDGIHHVRKQTELDGTESWFLSGINYYASIPEKKLRYELTKGKMLCTHFEETQGSAGATTEVGEFFEAYYSQGNRNGFFNYDNGEGGVDNFKSYLSQQKQAGTPVILEYELAEEEIEPYTEEQQKAYKQMVQTAKSYKNVTNIYSPDPVSPVFSINYRKDIDAYIDNKLANVNAQILNIAGGN